MDILFSAIYRSKTLFILVILSIFQNIYCSNKRKFDDTH